MDKEDSYLKPLHEKILKLSSKFPLPPNHGCFLRRTEKTIPKGKEEVLSEKIPNVGSATTGTICAPPTELPGSSTMTEKNFSGDYIAFSAEKDPMQVVRERPRIDLTSYFPPSFKRIPKNPNRIKKMKK